MWPVYSSAGYQHSTPDLSYEKTTQQANASPQKVFRPTMQMTSKWPFKDDNQGSADIRRLVSQCRHFADKSQIRTSALAKNFGLYKIYGVSAQTRGLTSADKGKGSIFHDFVRMSFMDGPIPEFINFLHCTGPTAEKSNLLSSQQDPFSHLLQYPIEAGEVLCSRTKENDEQFA